MLKCEYCDKVYLGRSAKVNLAKHLTHCISNPNSIRYKCDKCEREFDKSNALCAHKKFCGNIKEVVYRKRNRKKKHKTICQFCGYVAENGLKLGGHISTCKLNPNYEKRIENLIEVGKKRKHSEETKNKISESRKKYLKENPDKVPYKLNHSSKESYPEKYFNELFLNENIKVERYYYIGLYELDFCIPDKKIDIEIDGEQHYVDERIEKSDINRNEFLEKLGWTIIRIRWKDYQKLSTDEKKNYISELKIKLGM